jgi:CBS domain-containing protein
VKDRGGKIVGLICSADLLQVQSYSSAALLQSLEHAETVEQIADLTDRVPRLVKALIDSGAKARNVTRIMTSISECILQKLITMAIADQGEPPASFAFLTLGSEGREEETLVTDQDNAIIYENVPEEKEAEVAAYFAGFADKVCGWLNEVGYSFCEGEIMAKNPHWCKPLDRWKAYFSEWVRGATPEDLLKVNIFFDFRCSHGDVHLTRSLRRHINQELNDYPAFFLHLAQNCLLDKPPLNMFGNIAVHTSGEHENRFSIKAAMRMIIGFARTYSLQNNIELTNTLDRLEALRPKGILSAESHSKIADVYNCLMQLRLGHQARALTAGRAADNYINPKELKHIELELLKQSLAELSNLQHKLSFDFKGKANL